MSFSKKIYKNAFWMMSEKVVSIFGLFFVTSFVAKYVGPEIFGQIALSIAIFQVVQIIAQLGGDNILFKRVAKNMTSGIKLMKASRYLRAGIYILLSVPVAAYMSIGNSYSIFFWSVALSSFFSAIDMIAIFNNAQLRSKLNTYANIIGLIIGLGIRYLIAYLELDPQYLSIPIILTTLIPFLIRLTMFRSNASYNRLPINLNMRKIKVYSKYAFLSGMGIVASSISIALYTRVNTFFLGYEHGTSLVGIYSVAATLGTSWSFIAQAITTSFYSKIYAEKEDNKALRIAAKLNRIIFLISLIMIAPLILLGQWVINLLYGQAYALSYNAMVILCVGSVLSALGTVSYRYIVRLSGYAFLSKKMFSLLLISLPISYTLIHFYGVYGAAYSAVIIEFLSLTVLNYFFKRGAIWQLHKRSLFWWVK